MTPTSLRILLLQRDVSQADIALTLGLNRSVVNRVVNGHSQNPRIRRAVAKAIGLSYSAVWGEEDPGVDMRRPGPPVIRQHVDANSRGGRAA